ncbi:hypothetical protein [Actinacidiphila sp. bgisy160]|uniref:hypothetical protein n=1 Tax=Actinacidiphila sp. bgisy160 TaxID=3413796 RepID=UPI003D73EAC9
MSSRAGTFAARSPGPSARLRASTSGLVAVPLPTRNRSPAAAGSVMARRWACATSRTSATSKDCGRYCCGAPLGDHPIGFADAVEALTGAGDPGTLLVVRELRLPRVGCEQQVQEVRRADDGAHEARAEAGRGAMAVRHRRSAAPSP